MKELNSLSLRYTDGRLEALDQRQLPHREIWLDLSQPEAMIEAISTLAVRGAPLIGVCAACSLALLAKQGCDRDEWLEWSEKLDAARPTAVNLAHAITRMRRAQDPVGCCETIFEEDIELCEKMAELGAPLIDDGDSILTHCNTGGLATVGIGTALGVIRRAHESGKKIHVYVDETRPLLQGGRLTTWELENLGIPYTLISDSMAATLMRQNKIQKVFVGADRVARNGDFANKIGTYSVAVLARAHHVPFFPVAPWTTIDLRAQDGNAIPIEQRHTNEVRGAHFEFGSLDWSPEACAVYNPAFDITPARFVSGLITDRGLFTPSELAQEDLVKADDSFQPERAQQTLH